MLNYVIKNSAIIETRTDQEIKKGSSEELKPLCRTLNFGSGFDGWTPAFFCAPTPTILDSDDE